MRVLVTRPREDAGETLAALMAMGHEGLVEPLLQIRPVAQDLPDLQGFQALLITSRNGVRAFARLSAERALAVHAVGPGTAAEARAAGFLEVHDAQGDAHALADLVLRRLKPEEGPLLHASGRDVASGLSERLIEAGFDFRRIVLYAAEPRDAFSTVCMEALAQGTLDAALFFSPRTAATFADLITRAGLQQSCATMTAYCLSEAVAKKVSLLPWRSLRIAAAPNQEALLALL